MSHQVASHTPRTAAIVCASMLPKLQRAWPRRRQQPTRCKKRTRSGAVMNHPQALAALLHLHRLLPPLGLVHRQHRLSSCHLQALPLHPRQRCRRLCRGTLLSGQVTRTCRSSTTAGSAFQTRISTGTATSTISRASSVIATGSELATLLVVLARVVGSGPDKAVRLVF